MSNLSDLLPAGAGGKNVSFTANGTISQGDAVIIESSGQVAPVSSQSSGINAGQAVSGGQAMTYIDGCFDEASGYFTVIYDNNNQGNVAQVRGLQPNGSLGNAASFTVGNPTDLITAGTPTSVGTGVTIVEIPSIDRLVGLASLSSPHYIKGNVVTPGLNSTVQSSVTLVGQQARGVAACYVPSVDRLFVVGSDSSNARLNYNLCSVSTSTITPLVNSATGGFINVPSGVTPYLPVVTYDSTNDKIILLCTQSNNAIINVGTPSASNVSWAGWTTAVTGGFTSSYGYHDIGYIPDSDVIFIIFADSSNGYYPTYQAGRLSGTTYAHFGSAKNVLFTNNSYPNISCDYNSGIKKLGIQWASATSVKQQTVTFNGNTAVLSAVTGNQQGLNRSNARVASMSTVKQMVQMCQNQSSSPGGNQGEAVIYTPEASTVSSFVGIADENIANASTGNVTIKGGIASNGLSGLTPNSVYYVADDGTISTTSTGLRIGKALSTSSINLEFET